MPLLDECRVAIAAADGRTNGFCVFGGDAYRLERCSGRTRGLLEGTRPEDALDEGFVRRKQVEQIKHVGGVVAVAEAREQPGQRRGVDGVGRCQGSREVLELATPLEGRGDERFVFRRSGVLEQRERVLLGNDAIAQLRERLELLEIESGVVSGQTLGVLVEIGEPVDAGPLGDERVEVQGGDSAVRQGLGALQKHV